MSGRRVCKNGTRCWLCGRVEWVPGLSEICVDLDWVPLVYEEFRLKEYERERCGTRVDEIPDGNDRSIDAVRHEMMDDVLRG